MFLYHPKETVGPICKVYVTFFSVWHGFYTCSHHNNALWGWRRGRTICSMLWWLEISHKPNFFPPLLWKLLLLSGIKTWGNVNSTFFCINPSSHKSKGTSYDRGRAHDSKVSVPAEVKQWALVCKVPSSPDTRQSGPWVFPWWDVTGAGMKSSHRSR